jgi:5'-deoxynucleotidase YfbR-like HD superfamily hydrolase
MFADSWTASNTGMKINLIKPEPDSFNIEDIANALSKLCRFNGHLKRFYSVAQHSVHVAELVPQHLKLTALLHDASEAYICDVPTPFKRMLGATYTDVEDRLQAVIGEKFGVELIKLDPLIKQADRVMVVSERDALQDKPLKWSDEYENVLRYPGQITAQPHNIARDMFLKAFKMYSSKKDEPAVKIHNINPEAVIGIGIGGGKWSSGLGRWVYPGEIGYMAL